MVSMESIVVYVQENNTSYRVKLPTQEICRLCLDLTSLQPLWNCPYAKDFNNFKFIGVQLGFTMPENVCNTCLTQFNEIGVLLKKWQGSLYTYKKMEDNCAKIKQETNLTAPETVETKITSVNTKSEEVCETIQIVTKPEDEGEEEICETIQIVTKPEKVTNLNETLISKPEEESDDIMNFEMELADETEEILHIKTDLCDDAEEILRIETELPNESDWPKDAIKLEVTDTQSNPDSDAETKPIPDTNNAKNTKDDCKKKVESSLKICHKCGDCVTSLTQHYKKSYQCQAKNYKCPMCNVYCNNTVKLLDHQRAYHWDQISATLLTCHICGQTFKYGCSLKRHLLVHEKGKQFMCEICGKGYTRATDLRDHKNIHLKVKPYVCTYCGKSFTSKANQYTHMMRHRSPTNPNKIYLTRRQTKPKKIVDIICTICERHFTRQDFLDKHMISHGEDTRLRECRKCQIKFDTVEDYREHAETHKKREYLCPYCSKSFCSGVVLEQHTFTHTGERPFLCSLCGSKFRAPAHLKRHNMLIHNINRGKPFKCQYCEKTFALKENLLPHERIHTGEKPYGCHVCDKHFIDPSRRKKHVRRYHGEEEVKNIPSSFNSYNRS